MGITAGIGRVRILLAVPLCRAAAGALFHASDTVLIGVMNREMGNRSSFSRRVRLSSREIALAAALTVAAAAFLVAALTRAIETDPGAGPVAAVSKDS